MFQGSNVSYKTAMSDDIYKAILYFCSTVHECIIAISMSGNHVTFESTHNSHNSHINKKPQRLSSCYPSSHQVVDDGNTTKSFT